MDWRSPTVELAGGSGRWDRGLVSEKPPSLSWQVLASPGQDWRVILNPFNALTQGETCCSRIVWRAGEIEREVNFSARRR
jgi:hypothetical protein